MTLTALLQAFRVAAVVAGAKVSPSLQQTEHRGVWVFVPEENGDQEPVGACGFSRDRVVVTLRQHMGAGNAGSASALDGALEFESTLRTALVRSASLVRCRPRFLRASRTLMSGQAEWLESVIEFDTFRDDVEQ